MTVFIIKLIAMSTMLVDHTAYWFVDNNNVMRNIGRLAFISYAFLISECYNHLKDKPLRLKNHIIKLIFLCLITEAPYDQFSRCKWVNWEMQSVLPTLLLGFTALIAIGWWINKVSGNRVIRITGAIVICLAAALVTYFIRSGYEFGGVILIVLFFLYLQKADDLTVLQRAGILLLIDVVYICTYIWASSHFGSWPEIMESAASFNRRLAGSLIAVVPLAFYNGKFGYSSKWFGWLYSFFYPLQFVVFIIARHFIRGF